MGLQEAWERGYGFTETWERGYGFIGNWERDLSFGFIENMKEREM